MKYLAISKVKGNYELARSLLSSGPSYMVLFVTAVCNARCPMCFYWEEIESANTKLELRLEEFRAIARNLRNLHYLSIGGGEPFTRKDLSETVEAFYNHSQTRVVSIATNGAYCERVRELIQYAAQNCPSLLLKVQVSIDHLYEKHDKNRLLEGLFVKLMDTCRLIGQMRDAGANVVLSVATVLTPMNRNDLIELRHFLDENVPYDDLVLLFPRGNAKDSMFKSVTVSEYHEAKKVFEARRGGAGSFARLYQAVNERATKGIESYLKDGPEGYPWICVAGEKMITLTEKGVLLPCEMLYQIKPEMDSRIGNVRDFDYNIPAMLRTNKARKLREFIESTHCSCSYECAALANVVFTKRQWPSIAKEVLRT